MREDIEFRQAKIVVSPKFRSLGGTNTLQDLEEGIPGIITSGLGQAAHIIVVARKEAQDILSQTIQRIAERDYLEAHEGGTINVNTEVHVNLSKEEIVELNDLLEENVTSRLLALGVELIVYGKFFETKHDQIRVDVYLLDIEKTHLEGAAYVDTQRHSISKDLRNVVSRIAASIENFLARRAGRRHRRSFAVLPFRNISENPRWDTWREGLTEELITVLKNAKALQLIERGITAKYKNQADLDLAEAGHELNVDFVLWGSYDVFEGDDGKKRFIVRARLVETETGKVVKTFREEGQAGYDVQTNLAEEIMQALDVQPTSIKEVREAPTDNVDALEYVRIGIHHFDDHNYAKALSSFKEALKLDAEYSDAHFHLGLTYKTIKDYEHAQEAFKAALGKAYDRAFGKMLWKFRTLYKVYVKPVVDNVTLYIGSSDYFLYALDKHNGHLKWRQKFDSEICVGAFIKDDSLFVASKQSVYALNSENGESRWQFDLEGEIDADLVGSGQTLFVSANQKTGEEDVVGSLYALNMETGGLEWRYDLANRIAAPLAAGKQVIFGARDHRLYVLDEDNGALKSKTTIEGTINHAPAIEEQILYFTASHKTSDVKHFNADLKYQVDLDRGTFSEDLRREFENIGIPLSRKVAVSIEKKNSEWRITDEDKRKEYLVKKEPEKLYIYSDVFTGYVYAMDMRTGNFLWRLKTDASAASGPSIDNRTIYAAFQNKLYAINQDNGILKWIYEANDPIGAVLPSNGLVYITSWVFMMVGEHVLIAIDQETGQAYWRQEFSDTIWGAPSINDGVLYIGNRNHNIYAFNVNRTEVGLVRSVEIWNQIALVYLLQKDNNAAIEAFNHCIEIDPTFEDAYQNLWEIYKNENRMAKAIEMQQDYIKLLTGDKKVKAEEELSKVSGLKWTFKTPSLFAISLIPIISFPPYPDDRSFSPIVPSPCVSGEILYIGTTHGAMNALHTSNGQLKWSHIFENNQMGIRSSAVVWKKRVYFGSGDGHIYALDCEDGNPKWKYQTNGQIDSTPTIVSDMLYVGSDDGAIYALTADRGEVVWYFQTHGRVKSSPVVVNGILYIGSYDGGIYAIDVETGNLKWRYQTNDIINSSPRVFDGVVFLGPDDNFVYALDDETGTLKWKFQVEEGARSALKHGVFDKDRNLSTFGFLPSTPVVHQGIVYVGSNGSSNCQVYAIDGETGQLKWRFPVENGEVSSPVIYKNVLFVGAGGILFHDQQIYGLNLEDGSLLWKYKTDGDVLSAPFIEKNNLYCWSLEGNVYAFDMSDIPGCSPERDARFYVRTGDVHLKNKQTQSALRAFEKAKKLDPQDADAYAGLADCYEQLGKLDSQRETLEKYQVLDPSKTHTYWRLGNLYLQLNMVDKSIDQFKKYIKVQDESDKGLGHNFLGRAYLAGQMIEEAIQEYNIAIEIGSKYLSPNYGTQRDKDRAISSLFLTFADKAKLLSNQGDKLEEALDLGLLEEAVHLLTEKPTGYFVTKGLVYFQQEAYEESRKAFEAAKRLDPMDTYVLNNLGNIYLHKQEYEKAIDAFESAVKINSKDVYALTQLGAIHHEYKFQFEKSYNYFQQVWRLMPRDFSTTANLVEASISAGKFEKAEQLAKQIMTEAEDNNLILNAKLFTCIGLYLQGEEMRAKAELRDLISFHESLPDDFKNTWQYVGTVQYISDRDGIDSEIKQFLIRMIDFLQNKIELSVFQGYIPKQWHIEL